MLVFWVAKDTVTRPIFLGDVEVFTGVFGDEPLPRRRCVERLL